MLKRMRQYDFVNRTVVEGERFFKVRHNVWGATDVPVNIDITLKFIVPATKI